MRKYDDRFLEQFFCDTNLSCGKLAKILDISPYRVQRYLMGDGYALPCDAMKIDAAISVAKNQRLCQPWWDIQRWHHGDDWDEIVGVWNREYRKKVERSVMRQTENAVDIIMVIIDGSDVDEFHEYDDPLKNGGLDNYSKDEFIRRIHEKLCSAL